ncbi:hypothetical protein GDO86_007655 [Hymenochirus boettgeri]|uniref:Reelin domain-containing protein n=1 Tax=Hymenochirus boettgeri TaxID=247094 RepID=A0A8T2J1T6_9PIPI|nr:hypothetical protein GDO86_007655 [Hymenochirus boettgeri]
MARPPNVIILVITLQTLKTSAYPSGNVQASCASMEPNHNVSAQSSQAPYSLEVSNTTYSIGENITVTLRSPAGTIFKGFMIQAREVKGSTPLGTFIISSLDVQTLTCTTSASAVSHTSRINKTSIVVTWVPPSSHTSNIEIRATVVQDEYKYWKDIRSPKLTHSGTGGFQLLAPAFSQLLFSTSALIFVLLKL